MGDDGGATYAGAGVDIGAGDAAVERMKGLVPGIGGFGGQFPLDTARFTHPVLVASTDGVGTKLVVAQATGRYDTVGIDLVAMCVDDLVCVGAEPLFMLDYIATGKVDPDRIEAVVAGVGEGCRLAGCVADRRRDGGAPRRHGARRPRHRRLRRRRGRAGHAARARAGAGRATSIIGLPSPGLRSNGYTLARLVLLERAGRRALGDPAWDGAEHDRGRRAAAPVGDLHPGRAGASGQALRRRPARLRPHHRRAASWATCPASCPRTGGAVLERSSWVEPPIFGEIQRLGAVEEAEMDRVFNRGVGMALVVRRPTPPTRPGGPGRGRPALHGHRHGGVA